MLQKWLLLDFRDFEIELIKKLNAKRFLKHIIKVNDVSVWQAKHDKSGLSSKSPIESQ